MNKTVIFKDVEVSYSEYGNRDHTPVLLLHGYLETKEIWDDYAKKLSEKYFVITIDIPGHGKSGVFDSMHRMEDLTLAVDNVVQQEELEKFHLAGHSMGGYVVMAYREKFPDKLYSYVLFHSTCFADDDEKKQNRNREIELIQQGKKEQIINTNIPKAFADDHHDTFQQEIAAAKKIASTNPDEGIIALLKGMMERADRSVLIEDDEVPLLLIAGKKDNYLHYEVMERMYDMASMAELAELENSGHMGFVEEEDKALQTLDFFFTNSMKE